MKQLSIFVLMMVIAVGSAFSKDRASAHTTVKGRDVSVTYGQPKMKGRTIFGGLVPYGQVWRTGADEATEITLTKGGMFAGRQLDPGTYTLYTIPEKGEWTIILNSELKQWGAFNYDKIKEKNVLETRVAATTLDKPVETFTIDIKDNGITLSWEKTSVFLEVRN